MDADATLWKRGCSVFIARLRLVAAPGIKPMRCALKTGSLDHLLYCKEGVE